jgi:hypothetical protein
MRLGRYVNHCCTGKPESNLRPEYIEVDGKPAILLLAAGPIKEGDRLAFDYGEWNKETIAALPFLNRNKRR